jgi:hypothetical protein
MPRFSQLAVLAAAVIAVAGCSREVIREMGSLKDSEVRPQQRSAEPAPERRATKAAAEVEAQGDGDAIETGSIEAPDCQGEHLAYQATKEYLKNFGPKPPDQPGERGPCRRGAQ